MLWVFVSWRQGKWLTQKHQKTKKLFELVKMRSNYITLSSRPLERLACIVTSKTWQVPLHDSPGREGFREQSICGGRGKDKVFYEFISRIYTHLKPLKGRRGSATTIHTFLLRDEALHRASTHFYSRMRLCIGHQPIFTQGRGSALGINPFLLKDETLHWASTHFHSKTRLCIEHQPIFDQGHRVTTRTNLQFLLCSTSA